MKTVLSLPYFMAGALAAALLAGCNRPATTAEPASLPPVTVRVQVVGNKPGVATEEVVGTVRARLRSVIEAKVSGKIENLPVVPGQNVKAGELLAELNAREIQARVDQARAVRQQAEADLKRFTSLWEQKILSQAEYDNAQSKFHIANAAALEAAKLGRKVVLVDGAPALLCRIHLHRPAAPGPIRWRPSAGGELSACHDEARLIGRAVEMDRGGFGHAALGLERLPLGFGQRSLGTARFSLEPLQGVEKTFGNLFELLDENVRWVDRTPGLQVVVGEPNHRSLVAGGLGPEQVGGA